MRRFLLELFAAIALTAAAIIASATGVSANDVMVSKAFARASATPMATSGAAYFTVVNQGAEADRLLSVTTAAARSADVHRTVNEGGIMRMEPAGILDIPASGMVEMSPGGLHVMMTGLAAPLKKGSTVEMVLNFEKAGPVTVQVPVGAVAAGN